MRVVLVLAVVVVTLVGWGRPTDAADSAGLRRRVLALGELTDAPIVHPAKGVADVQGAKAVYFEGLPWRGKPTRVFARLGLPLAAKGPVPGVVLVHGGGGSAFPEWVRRWNDRGFAAISIAVEGQTDERDAPGRGWKRHANPGPARVGIYGDSGAPLADQWMYHAVADTILANSLLRSLPEVDEDRVGVMGISWGGVITSTVIGIDDRFAFAVPTYGCGGLATAGNQYGRALGGNALYKEVWDPLVRMDRVKLPVLWLSWTGDQHFPLDALHNCYAAAPGPHLVSLIPKMRHGHAPGWNPPDSYAFAESVVRNGTPWCKQSKVTVRNGTATVEFTSSRTIEKATLTTTDDTGFTGSRKWVELPATVEQNGDRVTVTTRVPAGTTAWFVNIVGDGLTASSDLQE